MSCWKLRIRQLMRSTTESRMTPIEVSLCVYGRNEPALSTAARKRRIGVVNDRLGTCDVTRQRVDRSLAAVVLKTQLDLTMMPNPCRGAMCSLRGTFYGCTRLDPSGN